MPTFPDCMNPPHATIATIRSMLDAGHVRPALAQLNQVTSYRFSAICLFDRDMLRNRYFFDRENPQVELSDDAPLPATYCLFVRDARGPFEVIDSLLDDRLARHPKRFVVRSYLGVPLQAPDGEPIGTLCHFDFARVVAPGWMEGLTKDVAPLFCAAMIGVESACS